MGHLSLAQEVPVLVQRTQVQTEQREQQEGEMARGSGAQGAWRKAGALGGGWGRLQLQILREESHQRNSKTQPCSLNPSPLPSKGWQWGMHILQI